MHTVFTAVIVAMIVLISGAVITSNVLGNVSQTTDYYSYVNTKNAMNSLHTIIDDISLEIGGSRHFTFTNTNGYFSAKTSDASLKFTIGKTSFSDSITKKEDDVFIRSGPLAMEYFSDIDDDGEDEIILENEAVLFAVEQVGDVSTEPYTLRGISGSVIAMFWNKQSNVSVANPVFSAEIKDVDIFNGALGYTEMVYNPTAVTNTVHMRIESQDLLDEDIKGVDIYFSLSGGNDFLEIRIVPEESGD